MRAIVRPPDSAWMKDAVPGVAYEAGDPEIGRQAAESDLLGKFNPGLGAQDFAMFESAKFVPKGSDIVFSMHYTSTGKPGTDRSKVGLVFAKHPPKLRYFVSDGPTGSNLAIPAGAENAEIVSEMTAQADTQLVYLQPHMHLRGKDYEVRLVFPERKNRNDLQGQVGFQLAAWIRPRETDSDSEGHAHCRNRALRQFGEQQVQSGSGKTGRLGQSELGRDAELLHGVPGGSRRAESQDVVQSVGRESVAARNIWPDACRDAVVLEQTATSPREQSATPSQSICACNGLAACQPSN